MCGIAGIVNFKKNLVTYKEHHRLIVKEMAQKIRHRGPDASGEWVGEHAALSHARLAVIDPAGGAQPMQRVSEGHEFVICYNGELYNADDLRHELKSYGYNFSTTSDTEVLLYSYIHYGEDCAKKLNGIFAFAVWDTMRQRVFLCRDRFGVKPLFYTTTGDTLVFASEHKAIFAHPEIEPKLDITSLREIFAISPARTPGEGVFHGIKELRGGHFMIIDRKGIKIKKYWELKSEEHTENYEDTITHTRELLVDAIKRQLVSDVPIGTLLSGGLDSSAITAIAANHMKENGKRLSTYSFDYEDNDKYFKASAFQPDADGPWVKRMSEEFDTDHTILTCPNDVLVSHLKDAAYYKDLPGMADVDASLLYFCREIKKRHTVVLSGECSDEIFGGYPWFRSEQAFNTPAFPWCYDLSLRESVLQPSVAKTLALSEYSRMRYDASVAETPRFDGDNAEEARRREISYLNIIWFMTNLLDRKDRMSMASGLEVRVPFCDHRLVEYVWNIPWEMKNKDNISKNILRKACEGILPDDVLYRKKSPYPKTHNPYYEQAMKAYMRTLAEDKDALLFAFVDKKKLLSLLDEDSDYGKPFFGQLMAGPQFLGYLAQVDYWLREYKPRIV